MRESAASPMVTARSVAADLLMHLDSYKALGGRQLSAADVSPPSRFVRKRENDDRHRASFSVALVLVGLLSSRETPGPLGGATTSDLIS